jgi:membrane associated rhomboid family serine protease
MSRYPSSSNDDHEPFTWLAGRAIYGAHFIVVVFVVSLLASCLLLTIGAGWMLDWVVFSSSEVLKGQVWRWVTYGLVNPPSLWFIVDMFMIVWFGRELEKTFGRRTFFALYGALYLTTPLLFTVIGLRWPLGLSGAPGALALFTAFATLYPNVTLCYGVLAKWAALLLIGIYALMHLSYHNWPALIALGATTGVAHVFVRHSQGRLTLPSFRTRGKSKSSNRQEKGTAVRNASAPDPKQLLVAEMDALLDQIAKSGVASLSPKQHDRLNAIRETLLASRKAESPGSVR